MMIHINLLRITFKNDIIIKVEQDTSKDFSSTHKRVNKSKTVEISIYVDNYKLTDLRWFIWN